MGGLRGSEDTIAAGTFDISPVEAAQTLKAADQPHSLMFETALSTGWRLPR
jgi:hypothetical protein